MEMDKKWPRKNLTAKIIALIIAIILWVYVMNEQNPPVEVTFQSALEVRNLATSLVVQNVPQTVRIKIRGPRSLVKSVPVQELKSFIDLKGLNEGLHTVRISTAIPANMEVIEVQPDKIPLTVDSIIARQLPIEIKVTGSPQLGAVVGKVNLDVSRVRAEGLKAKLDSVSKVIAIVDVTNRSNSFSAQTPLVAVNQEGAPIEGISLQPAQTNFAANILGEQNKKSVDVITTVTGQLPAGLELKTLVILPDKIDVYGDAQTLAQITSVSAEPIELDTIDKNTDKQVKLKNPEGLFVKNDKVLVRIEVSKK